jgi:hypothetical protein
LIFIVLKYLNFVSLTTDSLAVFMSWGAGISQQYSDYAVGWMIREIGFRSHQVQEISPFSTMSNPAFAPSQPLIQFIKGLFPQV